METAQEKIERWKGLANLFLKKNIQTYIKEINGDIHFCDILLIGEDSIYIYNFGPEQRKGLKDKIYWYLISEFDEYNNEVKNGQSKGNI